MFVSKLRIACCRGSIRCAALKSPPDLFSGNTIFPDSGPCLCRDRTLNHRAEHPCTQACTGLTCPRPSENQPTSFAKKTRGEKLSPLSRTAPWLFDGTDWSMDMICFPLNHDKHFWLHVCGNRPVSAAQNVSLLCWRRCLGDGHGMRLRTFGQRSLS